MFSAWGEGNDAQAPMLEQSPVAASIKSFQSISGEHYLIRASLTNGLWLALLAWAGAGLVRARYRRELLPLALTVLGIAAFTLVFQGRGRYLLTYVPVVIALAATVSPLPSSWPRRMRWRVHTPARAKSRYVADVDEMALPPHGRTGAEPVVAAMTSRLRTPKRTMSGTGPADPTSAGRGLGARCARRESVRRSRSS
jgi:hypothetical protein